MKLKSVEKLENSKVMLEVQVEKAEFDAAMDRSYRKNVSRINIPGFRKGKAPRKIIERMYGTSIFMEDAVNFAFPAAYDAAVEEAKIEPVDEPQVELDELDDNGFTFKATVVVKPEVTLGEYKGLTANKLEVIVSDVDINDELNRLRERNARMINVDRAAAEGDTVVIDFEGFVDGMPFEGGKAEKHNLKLGSNHFIPGFEDQLIGAVAGADVDVNVTFPEEYHAEDLAGKPAVFKVKVLEVKETELPELDDEFAKDVSEMDTLDALKEDIKSKIAEGRQRMSDEAFENAVLDQIVDNMTVELPEVMIERQLDRIAEDFANRVSAQGITMDAYLQMSGMDMEGFRKNFREGAERQVKVTLALEKIAELEKLGVTAEDVEAEYNKLAEQYGMPVERVKSYIPEGAMKQDIISIKTSEFIRDNSKAKLVGPEAAKKPAAKKSTAKKAAEDKEDGEKKAPAKKTTSSKSTATKSTTAKSAATKSSASKSTASKSTTAKKTTAKKADADDAAEKPATKKRTTKKAEDKE